MTYRKKLIEVALPLKAVNEGSKPETENPFLKGHPRAIHNWWARTPLSVARTILFAQLIDDPGEGLPPQKASQARKELLDFVSKLSTWDATTDATIISQAREMILKQFNGKAPEFWDMFAGRASIPLEAQRLGLGVTSSDLNPVAVTIQRALLEFPPQLRNLPPIHPISRGGLFQSWQDCSGMAEDIRWFGEEIRKKAAAKLALVYPQSKDGKTVVAWLWARTVECPNPMCMGKAPLFKTVVLCNRKGRESYLSVKVDKLGKQVRFGVTAEADPLTKPTMHTKGAQCPICGQPIPYKHIRQEAAEGRMGQQLMAIVFRDQRRLLYREPDGPHEAASRNVRARTPPDTLLPKEALGFGVQKYGMIAHRQLFSSRQLLALETISDLICEKREALLREGSVSPDYVNWLSTYLACALSRMTDYHCALTTWNPTNQNIGHLFQMQTIPMVWDFAEANPIEGALSYAVAADWVAGSLATLPAGELPGRVLQLDARAGVPKFNSPPVISTDPPYYDNIGYADLSDFFYIWLRRLLRDIDPDAYSTILTPKDQELIAYAPRHEGSEREADQFFKRGFDAAFRSIRATLHPSVPATIYYAFKESDRISSADDGAVSSTGWETMLDGLLAAGFQVTATIPVRTSRSARARALESNALASAIILAIRPRPVDASIATRKEFLTFLKKELATGMRPLIQASIAPVDLAQTAIGPGMSVFSRYAKVLEPNGSAMTVRTALGLINQALDEFLAEQEGEMDADSRFCLAWFEQYGMKEGPFGEADVLARAKNTSVEGIVRSGCLSSKAGKVRILPREEMPVEYDPATDDRRTVWECVQHLIKNLATGGVEAAGRLTARLGPDYSEQAKALAYRLFVICERRKWADEALAYNGLITSWGDVQEKAQSKGTGQYRQPTLG